MQHIGLALPYTIEDKLSAIEEIDPLTRKMINIGMTVAEKEATVNALGLKKNLDLTGYQDVEARFVDGDSGYYADRFGNMREFRIADVNRFDTFDTFNANQNSRYKQKRQPQQIANLLGKDISQLTPEDYDQADAYHSFAVNHFLNTGQTLPYNPGMDYRGYRPDSVGLSFKKIGKDKYGRDLVEAFNPKTESTVSFDLSNNPRLNSEFDIFNSIRTNRNVARQEAYDKKYQDYVKSQERAREFRENRIGESIDMVQSNAYQSFGRLMNWLPEGFKDAFNIDKEHWKKVASPITGQAIADAWAGVDPTTREDYSAAMSEGINYIKNAKSIKDYARAFGIILSQFDRFLADSAVQSTLAVAGTALGGGLGALAGAGKVGQMLSGSLLGGMFAGADETLSNMEEYRAEHGKDMDPVEAFKLFLGHIPIAGAEGLLGIAGAKRVGEAFMREARKGIKDASWGAFGKEAGKAFAKSSAYEGLQENVQQSWGEMFKRDDATPADLLGIALEPEQIFATMAGAAMGGGLSLGGTTARALSKYTGIGPVGKADKKAKAVAREANQAGEQTVLGGNVNQDVNVSTMNRLQEIYSDVSQNALNQKQLIDYMNEADLLSGRGDISEKTLIAARKVRAHLYQNIIQNANTTEEARKQLNDLGISPEDALKELIAFNHPDSAAWQIENEGVATDESKKANITFISDMAKKLGIDPVYTDKRIKDVGNDIEFGPYGFRSYENILQRSLDLANDETLETSERDAHASVAKEYFNLIRNLADNQTKKMSQFADAINRIASGKSSMENIAYESGYGGFIMDGSKLRKADYESGKNAHGVFQDLTDKAIKLRDVIGRAVNKDASSYLDKSKLDSLRKRYANITKTIDSYKKAADAIFTGVRLDSQPETNTSENTAPTAPAQTQTPAPQARPTGEHANRDYSVKMFERVAKSIFSRTSVIKADELANRIRDIASQYPSEDVARKVWEASKVIQGDQKRWKSVTKKLAKLYNKASKEKQLTGEQIATIFLSDSTLANLDKDEKTLKRAVRNTLKEANSFLYGNIDDPHLHNKVRDAIDRKIHNMYGQGEFKARPSNTRLDTSDNVTKTVKSPNPVKGLFYSAVRAVMFTGETVVTDKGDIDISIRDRIRSFDKKSKASKDIASAVLKPFIANQLEWKREIGKMKSFYNDKTRNMGNREVAALVLHSLYNDAMEQNMDAAKAEKYAARYFERLHDDVYSTESKVKTKENIQAYIDEQLERLAPQVDTDSKTSEPVSDNASTSEAAPQEKSLQERLLDTAMEAAKEADEVGIEIEPTEDRSGETLHEPTESESEINQSPAYDEDIDFQTEDFSEEPEVNTQPEGKSLQDILAEAARAAMDEVPDPEYDGYLDADSNNGFDGNDNFNGNDFDGADGAEQGNFDGNEDFSSPEAGIDEDFQSREEVRKEAMIKSLNSRDAILEAEEIKKLEKQTGTKTDRNVAAHKALYNPARHNFKSKGMISDIMDAIFEALGSTKRTLTMSIIASKGFDVDERTRDMVEDYIDNVLDPIKYDPGKPLELLSGESNNVFTLLFGDGTNLDAKGSIWNRMPADFLLYDINQQSANVSYKVNRLMALATRLETMDYVSSYDLMAMVRPTSVSEIISAFGVDEEAIKDKNTENAYRFLINNFGIPQAGPSYTMGRGILNILGMTERTVPDGEFGMFNRIVEGLGIHTIKAMEQEGIVKRDVITKERVNELLDKSNLDKELKSEILRIVPKNGVATIRPVLENGKLSSKTHALISSYLGKKVNGKRSGGGLQDKFQIGISNVSNPVIVHSNETLDLHVDKKIHHSLGQMSVPQDAQEALKGYQSKKYFAENNILSYIFGDEKRVNQLKFKLGFKPESELVAMELSQREAAISKNKEIEREISSILTTWEQMKLFGDDARLQFKYFMTRNYRFNIDSNGVNPQQQKHTSRSFFKLEDAKRKININDMTQQHKENEAFAVALAFDAIQGDPKEELKLLEYFDSLSLDDIYKMRDDYMSMSEDQFNKEWKSGFKLGTETVGSVLDVFEHFINKKQAVNGEFTTTLTAELDSTTSGYVIRWLQMPHRAITQFLEKVGVFAENHRFFGKAIDRIKKFKGFNDIYRTIGVNASERIAEMEAKVESLAGEERTKYVNTLFNSKKVNGEFLYDIYKGFASVLPRTDADGKVSSSFRTLIKALAIPFGYNAGEASIKRVLNGEAVDLLVKDYQYIWSFIKGDPRTNEEAFAQFKKNSGIKDELELARFKSLFDTFQKLNNGKPRLLNNKLKNMGVTKTLVTIVKPDGKKGQRSLEYLISDVVKATYGKAMWNSMDSMLNALAPYNRAINVIAQNAAKLFSQKIESELAKIEAEKGIIYNKDFDRLMNEYAWMMPKIPAANGGWINVMRTKKATGKTYNEAVRFDVDEKGNQKIAHSYGQGREFSLPMQAAAVIGIHAGDGTVLRNTMKRIDYKALPIHDAMVVPFMDIQSASSVYNEELGAVNRDNDMLANYADMFREIFETDESIGETPLIDPLGKPLTYSKKLYVTKKGEEIIEKGVSKAMLEKGYVLPSELDALMAEASKDPDPKMHSYIVNEVSYTWKDYLGYVQQLVVENKASREDLYSKVLSIGNMGGDNNVAIMGNKDTASEMEFKDVADDIAHSSAEGFTTAGERFSMMQEGLRSKEARIAIVDKLYGMAKSVGQTVESSEHIEHLKELIGSMDTEKIANFSLMYNMLGNSNQGEINFRKKRIRMRFYDNMNRTASKRALASMPMATTYAHEVTHGAINVALKDPARFGVNYEVRELARLMEEWAKTGSWKDLMPKNYDPALRPALEKYAKESFDYITKNKNNNGLAEFAAYAVTHEGFIEALKEREIKLDGKPIKFMTRVYNLVKAIFDALFHKGTLDNVLANVAALKHGQSVSSMQMNLYDSINELVVSISHANERAVRQLSQHPFSFVGQMYGAVKNKINGANERISKFLEKTLANDKNAKYEWKIDLDATKLDNVFKIFGIAKRFAYDKKARDAFHLYCQEVFGASQSGLFLSTLRDFSHPDERTQNFTNKIAFTRLAEGHAKSIESKVAFELNEAFGNKLTELHKTLLTKGIIHTDVQCLVEHGYSYGQIFGFLKDENKVLQEIETLKNDIAKLVPDEANQKYLINQALALALYATGRTGNEATNPNSQMILKSAKLKGKELNAKVDSLATMFALSLSDREELDALSAMDKKGLATFINAHNKLVSSYYRGYKMRTTTTDQKYERDVDPVKLQYITKGYSKQVFDTDGDFIIDVTSRAEELAKDGYNLAYDFDAKNGMPALSMYKKSYANQSTRDGTAFLVRGQNMFSEAISSSAYRMAKGANPDIKSIGFKLQQIRYMNRLDDVRNKISDKMKSKILTADEIRAMSSGFVPVYSARSGKLQVTDYQITVPMEVRENVVSDNLDGVDIISKMYASQSTTNMADFQNQRILNFLIHDMDEHMDKKTHTDLENGQKFIKLDADTVKAYFKNDKIELPNRIMEYAGANNLYVREDWMLSLFGNESLTISEAPLMKHLPAVIKTAIRCGEYYAKMAASMLKQNILLKVPAVLVNNIISNLMYSILNGHNPLKVMKLTIENFMNVREYMVDRAELDRILVKQRFGTASKSELARIEALQHKLESNAVAPLIQYGFFQAVLEDSSSNDMKNLRRITKSITDSTVYKMTPDIIKKGISFMYVNEGHPAYEFMANLTKISDFASRVTEYQLQMEKAPPRTITVKDANGKKKAIHNEEFDKFHDRLINELWMAFVNYDTPQSSVMQYMNDIGLVFFTKYAFRIQKAIRNQLWKNPIGALSFLLAGSTIMDVDNIMEQNVFQKNWSALFHLNPAETLFEAIVPMPLQYGFGTREFRLI